MAKKQDQKLVLNQLIVKAPSRRTYDVGEWRTALRGADMGRIKQLYDLFDDLLIDGVLSDAVEKRVMAVTNAAITFQNDDGEEIPEILELIDTPAFEELLTTICNRLFWGRSGGEFDFTQGFGFTQIPAKHIKLENRTILINDSDESGIPYTDDDHILVLGRQRNFGLLLKTAPYAIWKRGGFGDYAQWLEIFGMPQRVGKYSSYDAESRKLLEQALEQAGSAPYVVIPKESEVETTNNTGSGSSGASYNDFRRACNEEILITILGQTLTTTQNDTGARSLGEVHKEVEEGKNRSDMRYVQRILNQQVLPILEMRGYPVFGGRFVFPEAAEQLSVNDIVQLSDILEIPAAFLHDKYSIPSPKNGEPIARRQPAANPFAEQVVNPPASEPVKKKSEKIENADHVAHPKKGLFNFFADAPQWTWGAIRNLFLSDANKVTALVDVDKLFSRAVKEIYRKKGFIPNNAGINPDIFSITNNVLRKAADTTFIQAGVDWGAKNIDFINQFHTSTAVFSAFKAHNETADIVKKLYREDGSIKGFSEFKRDVLSINKDYNKNWLQTEYNTALRSARMAVNWKKFQETRHLYPNLEYMPSRAANPRDSHRRLWHMVFPIDDPAWSSIMPPSEWNCLCSVRATDKPVTQIPPDFEWPHIDPVFATNPGESAEFVKIDETGYYKSTSPDQRPLITMYAEAEAKKMTENIERIARNSEQFETLKQDKSYTDVAFNPENGGLKATHVKHNFDHKKGKYEVAVQNVGYSAGHTVILEAEQGGYKIRFADGKWDNEVFEIAAAETGTSSNIKGALNHCAGKPDTKIAVIYFPMDNFAKENAIKGINRYNGLGRSGAKGYVKFSEVIFINKEKILYRHK